MEVKDPNKSKPLSIYIFESGDIGKSRKQHVNTERHKNYFDLNQKYIMFWNNHKIRYLSLDDDFIEDNIKNLNFKADPHNKKSVIKKVKLSCNSDIAAIVIDYNEN